MFIAELQLYINYLSEELAEDSKTDALLNKKKHYSTFYGNLKDGIAYYRQLPGISVHDKYKFAEALYFAEGELDSLNFTYQLSITDTEVS